VTTTAQYEEAGAKLQAIKALSKKLDETFDPHIKRAFEAHRGLVAEKKTHQSPLQTAEALIKRAMLGYQQDEERKRLELEAKAQEEARKEREKLEAQAAKLAAAGKVEKAEAKMATAAAVVAPMIAPTTPKLAGISMRTTYRAEVT
jgi:cell wall assembly regulator SMI1